MSSVVVMSESMSLAPMRSLAKRMERESSWLCFQAMMKDEFDTKEIFSEEKRRVKLLILGSGDERD